MKATRARDGTGEPPVDANLAGVACVRARSSFRFPRRHPRVPRLSPLTRRSRAAHTPHRATLRIAAGGPRSVASAAAAASGSMPEPGAPRPASRARRSPQPASGIEKIRGTIRRDPAGPSPSTPSRRDNTPITRRPVPRTRGRRARRTPPRDTPSRARGVTRRHPPTFVTRARREDARPRARRRVARRRRRRRAARPSAAAKGGDVGVRLDVRRNARFFAGHALRSAARKTWRVGRRPRLPAPPHINRRNPSNAGRT